MLRPLHTVSGSTPEEESVTTVREKPREPAMKNPNQRKLQRTGDIKDPVRTLLRLETPEV